LKEFLTVKMNRAQLFKQKREETRQKVAVPHTLPGSGIEVMLCRPDLETWMLSGRIPQAFTSKVLQAHGGGKKKMDEDALLKSLEGRDLVASLVFVRDFVRETLVSPKIVTDRLPDYDADEIAPSDLEKDDLLYIFRWAMAGAPDIPVALNGGGETSVKALGDFPGGRAGHSAGADQQEVRRSPERPPRHKRRGRRR
jgi:hypothetical protein